MRVFNSSGSLKVSLSPTSSAGASPLTVIVSGSHGSVNASNVTTLTFSGSFLTASSPATDAVTIKYTSNAPIMYLSGFRGSATESERNLYMVTSSGFFSGSEIFMCSVLYSEAYHGNRTHLAGVSHGTFGGANDWGIETFGNNGATNGTAGAFVDVHTIQKLGGLPYCGKWFIFTMYKVGTEIGMYLNGGGGLVTTTLLGSDYLWSTDVSYSIGVANNGNMANSFPSFISAVALKTASFVPQDGKTIGEFHERVIRDGDIVQDSIMNWDHIWSVKQNTPGAVWRDSVGAMHLNRSGTLSILTESIPRWA